MASARLTIGHHGQPITVSIRGSVVDEFGQGVSGAGVMVLQGELTLKSVLSNEFGQFDFNNLETKIGFHKVRAAKRGWQPTEEELPILKENEGQSTALVLRLQSQDDVADVSEVEVEMAQIVEEEEFESPASVPGAKEEDTGPEKPYEEVRVFFATDRNKLLQRGKVDPKKFFGNDRSSDGTISFGYCNVSIPSGHKIGKIERPTIFRLYKETAGKHIVLLKLELLGEAHFFQSVEAKASDSEDVLFFVHGYHVTFPEAVRRTAQIASDLNFAGTPICYSWPSAGRYFGYSADEASVEWTFPHLLEVLRKTASLPKITTIHLIAHSMGNRALVRCLEEISKEFSPESKSRFQQVILAAPDVDAVLLGTRGPKLFQVIREGLRSTGDCTAEARRA